MFNNRQKYELESSILPKLKLTKDPINWEKSKTEVGRSETTNGMFISVTNNLEFIGEAFEYIETNYQVLGTQAKVKLTKFKMHPITDEWELEFTGYLNFGSRKIENKRLKIDFVEGGLRELLVAQMRENFELDRATDVKGNPISRLRPDQISIKGRDLFLLSRLEGKNTTAFKVISGLWQSQGDYRETFKVAPLDITALADDQNIRPPVDDIGNQGRPVEGDGVVNKFFALADRDRGKTRVEINLDFRIDHVYTSESFANEMKVFLRRYTDERETGGLEFTFAEDYELIPLMDPRDHEAETFSKTLELELYPKKGESFALYFWTRGIYGTSGIGGNTGQMQVYIDNYKCTISWEEDSFYPRTVSNFMTAKAVGDRLSEIYTGRPSFRSKFLSETWKDLGFTGGFWLRNMSKYDQTEEGEKEARTLTMSFENYYKSIHAVEPVGYGIITEGNRQYIALEHIRYFFQPYTTIRLGKVSNVKRRTAVERIHTSITTGYTKGGNYEKPLGLDEPNIKSTSITPITVDGAGKYEVLGPSRTDSYAVEQVRRLQAKDYPEEDTPYDRDPFLIDAKIISRSNQGSTVYEPRLWQDDFEKAPTGVYSPSTIFNLRLTPGYNKLRHACMFNGDTVKTPDEKLIYATNEGNSKLSTKMTGKAEMKENQDFLFKELANPISEPEWVEFELPFKQQVKDQILGKTKVGNEWINNYYGVVEFINEKNKKEKAHLFSAKIEGKITFKTLKAYGV